MILPKNGLINWYVLLNGNFFLSIFDIENRLWKYNFGTFWWNHQRNFKISFLWVRMLILGQKHCLLGPTIFEIPQPNWYYNVSNCVKRIWFIFSIRDEILITQPYLFNKPEEKITCTWSKKKKLWKNPRITHAMAQ